MADVLVLCYHAVSPSWDVELSVTPESLERDLRYFARSSWTVVPFTQAVLNPPAPRTLALTFDDAFASVRRFAAPLFERFGFPATLFVPTDYISAGGPLSWPGVDHWLRTEHARELEAMSWDDVRELADAGWEIGSHTCSHAPLTQLSDAQLAAELQRSRAACSERVGRECTAIAYPYGDVDHRVAQCAAAAGYLAGASLSSRLANLGPYRWPRTGVWHGEAWWKLRLKFTRPIRALRASRSWPRS
ncbi:MAG: polysaccharide deacetylase family protein [Solirubrobacterales bacterium]|nr:polysaccharide deacetylase family protein [Solirubrobacterales bacterium]